MGPVGAILVNSASYVGSALCLWRMRVPGADLLPMPGKGKTGSLAQKEESQGIKAVLCELLDGFAFVWKTRVLLLVAILAMIAMFGAGAINSLDIIYVSQRLHANPNLYGYVTAASGLGALIGALVCGVLAKRISSRVMLAGSLIFCGIGIVIYALQTWIVLGVIFAFIISLPQGGIDVGFTPLLMSVTPRRFMGRVGSILDTGISGATLLAIALCGALGTFVPVYLLLLVGGILITIAGVFGWLALPKTVPSAQEESAESQLAREPAPVD
jgi:MFS family permease